MTESTRQKRQSLIVMTRSECVELLETTSIGRVVFIEKGQPVALPVNYRWFDGSIVFRALEGTSIYDGVGEALVSFEVDRWNDADHSGESVLVKGRSTEVTDWAEIARLEELGVVPWARNQWRQAWVRIDPTDITGRRLG